MKKQIICSFALLAILSIPTQSHAATPDLQTLTSQLQMLTAQFQSLKTNKSSASSTPRMKMSSSTVDRTCMATAVTVREDSLASAWSTFNTKIVKSLEERQASLVSAWNTTDTKVGADSAKSAWSAWKADKKSAHEQIRKDRKAAWETFKTTAASTCKATVPKEESLEKTAADSIAI